MKGNIEKIITAVAKSDLDALLVITPDNRFYATGFRSSAGLLAVTSSEAVTFLDPRYAEEAGEKIKSAKVVRVQNAGKISNAGEYFKGRQLKRIGVEEKLLTYMKYKEIEEVFPNAELVPAQSILENLRMVKTQEELEIMIKAQRIAEKSMSELVPMISTNMTEKELASELFCLMLRNGAEDKSFGTIAVSGERSSMPHGKPEDRKIQYGFLTIDFGCKLNGYCSDTTRTFCIGEPTKEMEKVYNTVLQAQIAAEKAAHGGIIGEDLDAVARNVIKDAGYGEYFSHSLSHGLGIEVHEAPRAAIGSKMAIPVGAVISNEPGIYIPGKFGVRIEDVLHMTEGGCENITRLPKELTVICS